MRLPTLLKTRQGMTLIEILVALGVFTIGILTIVRIFPTGFSILKHQANVSITDHLAQAELERIEAYGSGIPAGILSGVRLSDGSFQFVDQDFSNIETTDPNYSYSDVNKFHFVYEESTQIPAPDTSETNQTAGSMYNLMFGPIVWDHITADDSTGTVPSKSLIVYSGPMKQIPFNGTTTPDDTAFSPTVGGYELQVGDYSVDYTNGAVYVAPNTHSYTVKYVMSYSYWTPTTSSYSLVSVVGTAFTVPSASNTDITNGYQAVTLSSVITLPSGAALRQGSIALHRGFDQIAQADTFSGTGTDASNADPNPYQFKIRCSQLNGQPDLPYGIEFNPIGYGKQEPTSTGSQLITAYICYDVLDWHIIHDERKVPDGISSTDTTNPSLQIKLSLGSIKKMGFSTEYDGSTYAGISKSPLYPELQYDVIVLDLTDGQTYKLRYSGGTADITMVNGSPAFSVDYKNGIVTFNPYFSGHAVRIYYKAIGDWAVEPYRPFASFHRSLLDPGMPAGVDYSEYYVGSNTNTQEYGKIYFPKCYQGMDVTLDYTYAVPQKTQQPDGSYWKYYSAAGEVHNVSSTTDPSAPYLNLYYIDVATELNNLRASEMPSDGNTLQIMLDGSLQTVPDNRVVIMPDARSYSEQVIPGDTSGPRVLGTSLGVRVIRKDNGEGFQGGHWRSSDLRTAISFSR